MSNKKIPLLFMMSMCCMVQGSDFFRNVAARATGAVKALRPTSAPELAEREAKVNTLIQEATKQAQAQLRNTTAITAAEGIRKALNDLTSYQNQGIFSEKEMGLANEYTNTLIQAYKDLYAAEVRATAISLQLDRLRAEQQKNPTDSTLQTNIRELNVQLVAAQQKMQDADAEIRTNRPLLQEVVDEATLRKKKAEERAAKRSPAAPSPVPTATPVPTPLSTPKTEPLTKPAESVEQPKLIASASIDSRQAQIADEQRKLRADIQEIKDAMESLQAVARAGGEEPSQLYIGQLIAVGNSIGAYDTALGNESKSLGRVKTSQNMLADPDLPAGQRGVWEDNLVQFQKDLKKVQENELRLRNAMVAEQEKLAQTKLEMTPGYKGKGKVIAPSPVPAAAPTPLLAPKAEPPTSPAAAVKRPTLIAPASIDVRKAQIVDEQKKLGTDMRDIKNKMDSLPGAGGKKPSPLYAQLDAVGKSIVAYANALGDESKSLSAIAASKKTLEDSTVSDMQKNVAEVGLTKFQKDLQKAKENQLRLYNAMEDEKEKLERITTAKGKEKVSAPAAAAAPPSPRPILRRLPAPETAKPKQVAFAATPIRSETVARARVPLTSPAAGTSVVAEKKGIQGVINNFNELPKLEKQMAQRAALARQLEVLERQQKDAEGNLEIAEGQAKTPPKTRSSAETYFKGAMGYTPAQNVAEPQEALERAKKSVADTTQKVSAAQKQLDEFNLIPARIDQLNNEISEFGHVLQKEQQDTAKSAEDLQNQLRAITPADALKKGALNQAVLAGEEYQRAIFELNAQLGAFNTLKEEENGVTSGSAVKERKAMLVQRRGETLGVALKAGAGKGVETAEAFNPNKELAQESQKSSSALAAEVALAEKKLLAQEEKMNTLGADFKRKQEALKQAPLEPLDLVEKNIAAAKNFLSEREQLAGAYSSFSQDEKKAWDAGIKDAQQILALYQKQEKALKGGFTTESTLYKGLDDQISYLKTQIKLRGLSDHADVTSMIAVLGRQLAYLADQIDVLNGEIQKGGTDLSKVQAQRDSMQRYREQLIALRNMIEEFNFYKKSKNKTPADLARGLSEQAAAIRKKAVSMIDLQANVEDATKQVADQWLLRGQQATTEKEKLPIAAAAGDGSSALDNATTQMIAAGASPDEVNQLELSATKATTAPDKNVAQAELRREVGQLIKLKNWFAQKWSTNWKIIVPSVLAIIAIPVIGITLFALFAPEDHKRSSRNMAVFLSRLNGVGVDLADILYVDLQAAYDKIVAAGYNITTISDQDLLRITGFVPTLLISQPPQLMRSYSAIQKDKKRILV